MKKLAIWGAGGTGIQIIEIAQWQNEEEHLWDEIFFAGTPAMTTFSGTSFRTIPPIPMTE